MLTLALSSSTLKTWSLMQATGRQGKPCEFCRLAVSIKASLLLSSFGVLYVCCLLGARCASILPVAIFSRDATCQRLHPSEGQSNAPATTADQCCNMDHYVGEVNQEYINSTLRAARTIQESTRRVDLQSLATQHQLSLQGLRSTHHVPAMSRASNTQ